MDRLRKEWARSWSSSLAHNAGWIFLGQGLSLVCRAFYFILLARLLGRTEYGVYAGVFATVQLVSIYSSLGSGYTLLRHVSPDPQKLALFWGNVLATTLILGSLFIALLAWGVPQFAHSYSWKLVLCVAVGDCICTQLTDSVSRVFQAFEKMRITAGLSLLINLLRTILAAVILGVYHKVTAQQWVEASLAISILGLCLALTMVTWRFGRPAFSARVLRDHCGEGVVFALSASTAGVYNNFDKAMLGHYGMNAANGIYAMAYRIIDLSMSPISSTHDAATPRFFQKGVEGLHSTSAYASKILQRTSLMGLMLAAVMFLGSPLIPHLVGKSFTESSLALRWLCLLPLFRSIHWSAGDALTGAGYQKVRLSTQAGAAAFNFALNVYLIPRYGWFGAAWSSLATDGMLGVVNWMVILAIRSQGKETISSLRVAERNS